MNIYIVKLLLVQADTLLKTDQEYQLQFTCKKSINNWTYNEEEQKYIREDKRATYSSIVKTYKVGDNHIISSIALDEKPTEEQLKAIEIVMRGSMKNFLDEEFKSQTRLHNGSLQTLLAKPSTHTNIMVE